MTEQVDRLIYNTLSNGDDLSLPGIGSLIVQRGGAKLKSSKQLMPPCVNIVFSRESRGRLLTDVIAAKAEISTERADSIYRQWLQHVAKDDVISINGVGEIRGNRFIIDGDLYNLLNPLGAGCIGITTASGAFAKRMWLFASAVVVVAAVCTIGYIYSTHDFSGTDDTAYVCDESSHVAINNEEPESVALCDTTADVEDGVTVNTGESPDAPASMDEEPMSVQEETNAVLSMTTGYSYIVWGVYVELSNAEMYMDRVNRRFNDINGRIYHYGNRYMVALYELPTREECVNIVANLRKRSADFKEVWIYTDKK